MEPYRPRAQWDAEVKHLLPGPRGASRSEVVGPLGLNIQHRRRSWPEKINLRYISGLILPNDPKVWGGVDFRRCLLLTPPHAVFAVFDFAPLSPSAVPVFGRAPHNRHMVAIFGRGPPLLSELRLGDWPRKYG